jgi:hypothetical protein
MTNAPVRFAIIRPIPASINSQYANQPIIPDQPARLSAFRGTLMIIANATVAK